MVDEAEVRLGVESPLRLGIHAQFRKGKLASGLPDVDRGLDLRSPEEIGLLSTFWTVRSSRGRAVVVVTADLVLCAVSAGERVSVEQFFETKRRLPLRKGLVAANVPLLAGFATFPRLGMATARRTTTGTGHF